MKECSRTHGCGSTRALIVLCLVALGFLTTAPTPSSRAGQEQHAPPDEELRGLLATLRDEEVRRSDPERLAAAIDRIKQLRSGEAVDDLAALITFRRPEHTIPGGGTQEIHLMTDFSWYPAMGALAEIGAPSVEAVSRVIGEDDGRTQATPNALRVLYQVFRYRPAEGADYLDGLAQRLRSPTTAKQVAATAADLRTLIEN